MALTLGDNFSYQGSKPLDARLNYSTVAAMKAVADSTMYNGCIAYCTEADKTYQWKSTNTVDETLGKWREYNSGGGGGGGAEYTAGDGIDITEDVISTKKSASGDIDEIIDRYPMSGELVSIVNAFNKGDLYSADEKMIGQWIDGKPLYQKTIQATIPTAQGAPTDISIGASVDTVVDANTMFATGNGGFIQTPVINGALSGSVRLSAYNNSYAVASLQNKFRLEQLSGTAVMGGSSCYVTVKYTKTTDSAVDSYGTDTTYSTSEKVVGTWIDGSPVYQLTHTENSTISCAPETWTNTTLPVGNISRIVHGEVFNNKNILNSFFISCTSSYVQLLNYRSKNTEVTGFTIQYTKTT